MNVYELLKNEVGLSDVEVNKYFDTRENEKSFVMKLRDKAWLGTATYRALQLAVEKHGGKYEPRPPTWTIPKDGSNPTPQTPSATQAEPEPETEDGYDLKVQRQASANWHLSSKTRRETLLTVSTEKRRIQTGPQSRLLQLITLLSWSSPGSQLTSADGEFLRWKCRSESRFLLEKQA